jgi:hypothetical protein
MASKIKIEVNKTPEQLEAEKKALEAHEAKIAELKKKHSVSDVFTIKVGDAVAYIKKPGRAEVAMARGLGEGDYIKTNELLLDALWLEGDEIIRTNDDYFLNVIPYLESLIEKKFVEIKKN